MSAIYLIDGSAYIYRAYHAIAPLTNSRGVATNAVLGFINMIHRLQREESPERLAIAFDAKGPTFRHQIYDAYKANRPPMPADLREQLPWVKKFVVAAGLPLLEVPGVEADDIIATLCRRFRDQGERVVIVSGDKDLLQLVGGGVTMFDPMKNIEIDVAGVEEKYGIPASRLLDYFALVGDSADNVPGVPGVGPKTAAKLIGEFGSLEGLYQNVDSMKKSKMKEKIIAAKEQAFLSRTLIELKYDVDPGPEAACICGEEDSEALVAIYTELEFNSLLKGVDRSQKIDPDIFHILRDVSELEMLGAELDAASLIVIDTETTSLNARRAELVGISLCTSLERAYYLPIGHRCDDGSLEEGQLDAQTVLDFLRPRLTGELPVVAHNLKYDWTVLASVGCAPSGPIVDTLVAAHLCEAGRSLKLDDLCRELGICMTPFDEVTGGDTAEDCFARVAVEAAGNYSCEDVYGTLALWQHLAPQLEERGLEKIFYEVEMPVLPILARMEIAGIAVDTAVLAELKEEFSARLATLEEEIYALAGHEFTIGSPKQLAALLFDELGLPRGRKTKTGYSTDVKVLEKLAKKHPLPGKILEYRSFAKLLSTYVDGLVAQQEEDGRVHTSFNQAVTATGRLSSTDPNLQNIPIRSEEGGRIREALVPADGRCFLAADYSQIDLRVLAVYSQDEALLAAFRSGEDIHSRTAAEIFGVSPLMVNAEMRRMAKSINFGIVYGMSAFGLSAQLEISRQDAQRFIDRYFGLYTGVERFMKEVVARAKEDGFVTTLLGRRRTLPELAAKNRNRREFAERMAINTPIQGTAADIIKLAMIGCDRVIREHSLAATMLLQIHDELVFELPEEEVEEALPLLRRAMEGAVEFDVPLVVNFERGRSLKK